MVLVVSAAVVAGSWVDEDNTVKPTVFGVPSISRISQLGDCTKINCRKYLKSRAISVCYLVRQAKMQKLIAPN